MLNTLKKYRRSSWRKTKKKKLSKTQKGRGLRVQKSKKKNTTRPQRPEPSARRDLHPMVMDRPAHREQSTIGPDKVTANYKPQQKKKK